MSPRIAFRRVVLPAPFGPIKPRMRPSSTRRSIPSSATVEPNAFRRPRASMHGMMSAFLLLLLTSLLLFYRALFSLFLGEVGTTGAVPIQQIVPTETQPLNGLLYPGPLFSEKFLALAFQ